MNLFFSAYTRAGYQAPNTLCNGCHGDESHIPRNEGALMQWAGCRDEVLGPELVLF